MRDGYSLAEWAKAHADSGMVQAREVLLLIEERDMLKIQLEEERRIVRLMTENDETEDGEYFEEREHEV